MEENQVPAVPSTAGEIDRDDAIALLGAWCTDHGSDHAKALRKAGYDSWISVALNEATFYVSDQLVGHLNLTEIQPGGTCVEELKCPSLKQLRFLDVVNERLKNSNGSCRLMRIVGDPPIDVLELSMVLFHYKPWTRRVMFQA